MQDQHTQPDSNKWKGKIACQMIDNNLTLDKSQVKTAVNSYIYVLFEKGTAKIKFDKYDITVHPGEFIIFPPHIPPVPLEISPDCEAFCLIVSSSFIYDCPITRNVFKTAAFSLINNSHPAIKLSEKGQALVRNVMMMIQDHINHEHHHTTEALQSLYGLLLSDVMAMIEHNEEVDYSGQRAYQLFIEFNKLLRVYFREHHDITFYAEQLQISPRYLSMVTKQISSCTVASFINRHLMLEACWLLKTTDYSIQHISEILHFADQASFSKFFKRINGQNPLQYRREQAPAK